MTTMRKRLALATFLATTLVAPALALNPQPLPPIVHPDSDVLLEDGSTIHIAADGKHVTMLKGGKQLPLAAGDYKLKDGALIRVGPAGSFKTINIGSQSGGAGAGK